MKGVYAISVSTLEPCNHKVSFFFDLIKGEWNEPNGHGKQPLHRICTLMRKMGVSSFLKEELEINEEIEGERQDVEIATESPTSARALRYTFFRRFPSSGSCKDLKDDDILGYAVILTLRPAKGPLLCYILESVVRPPTVYTEGFQSRSTDNYYIHCFRTFETVVGTRACENPPFKFPGTFFCQQNGKTHVCGHAALRIAINSFPSRESPKLTNKAINDALGFDHTKKKRIPPEGLEVTKLIEFIKHSGFEPHVGEFADRPSIDYEHFAYPIVESACPVILNIANPQMSHVVTILGHTFNSDRWAEAYHGYGRPASLPNRQYISASAWTDHFIQNDDNFGMYVTLPIDQIKNFLVPRYNPNLYAAIGVGLMPKGIIRSGYKAEMVAQETLNLLFGKRVIENINKNAPNRWLPVLMDNANKNQLVLRTLLAEKGRYIAYMKTVRDELDHGFSVEAESLLEAQLPEQFWITEVTLPDLYTGNKRKLAEVLVSSTVIEVVGKRQDPRVFVWLPGACLYGQDLGKILRWPFKGHIPLFRGQPCFASSSSEW